MSQDACSIPADTPWLAVRRLTLTDFRCYPFLRLDTESRPVVLTGANGAGKTNLLEALSLLTPGRGLRRAKLSEMARQAAGEGAPWAVAAVLCRPAMGGGVDETEIGTGREAGTERRVVRIDGQPARTQSALAEILSVVWLTPSMDRLFQESASGRRRFLDRLVYGLDPAHAGRVNAYEHALRERARLLKTGGDPQWLAVLEETMALRGVEIAAARRDWVGRLDQACRAGIGPFPAAGLELSGMVERWLEDEPGEEVVRRLQAFFATSRRRDSEAGGAADGPHRTDLAVRHRPKDMPAGLCSTGEQKALLVSIVLAQARVQAELRGAAPLMLLDEVVAHLDETRRNALFDELCALGAQSWLTGTDAALFAGFGSRAQFFRVDDACVTRQQ
ncbi:DNA replication/repair protein RecF [Telmatospirillum sp. J64-1]|uniref:DNA replication/repair protein RecF n=1 Tax=Telmatospirillum sp. J64-1 TaxID=2502183 RepID=UPI00115E2A77|nr:DNA replication/repair protein RecF [Telmatospirillum sp. J64-1]